MKRRRNCGARSGGRRAGDWSHQAILQGLCHVSTSREPIGGIVRQRFEHDLFQTRIDAGAQEGGTSRRLVYDLVHHDGSAVSGVGFLSRENLV